MDANVSMLMVIWLQHANVFSARMVTMLHLLIAQDSNRPAFVRY
jgi:hypothetical protein